MTDQATPAMIRRDRNRQEMRDTILSAARTIVVESGVSALSMRAVARAIGYSVAALYEYFPSKSALCRALFFEGANGLAGRIRATIASLDAGTRPRVAARTLGVAYRDYALENRELYLLVFTNPVAEFEPDESDRRMASGGYDLLVEAMRAGVESGEMRHMDPDIAALASWSVVHGFVMLEMLGFVGDGSREESDAMFAGLLDHVSGWHGDPDPTGT